MTRYRHSLMLLITLVVALTACNDSPTEPEPPAAFAVSSFSFIVWPDAAELQPGQTQDFGAYVSTRGTDFGADGEPGTADDDYQRVTATWSVIGEIGQISTTAGANTTLGAELPAGSTQESGTVRATLDGEVADADVVVIGESEPIGNQKLCVQFKKGTSGKKPIACTTTYTKVYVSFDAGKKIEAKVKGDAATANDSWDTIVVTFDKDGYVVKALWAYRSASENVFANVAAKKVKVLEIAFPEGSDGLIQSAFWNGPTPNKKSDQIIKLPNGGRGINGARIYTN